MFTIIARGSDIVQSGRMSDPLCIMGYIRNRERGTPMEDFRTDTITEAQMDEAHADDRPENEDEEWVDGIGWVDWATYTDTTY
jgi:hypothetical protein